MTLVYRRSMNREEQTRRNLGNLEEYSTKLPKKAIALLAFGVVSNYLAFVIIISRQI